MVARDCLFAPRKPGVRRVRAHSGFITALKMAFDQITSWMFASSTVSSPPAVNIAAARVAMAVSLPKAG